MRLLILGTATLLPAVSAAAPPAAQPVQPRDAQVAAHCPRAATHYAIESGKSVRPQKLNELPQATTFMAVYRTKDGCMDPLTLVEYRGGARR